MQELGGGAGLNTVRLNPFALRYRRAFPGFDTSARTDFVPNRTVLGQVLHGNKSRLGEFNLENYTNSILALLN